jgi:hypothetical protein
MAGQTRCPRCGARDSFSKGYLPETCVCRVCMSQLDWREIPGCGPDCRPAPGPETAAEPAGEGWELDAGSGKPAGDGEKSAANG